ncbi:MAG: type II 3-dehydroquinate dehydratase [Pseudomonadota bacterium]
MNPETLKKTKILVLNGPNLNLLGSREPEIYGRSTLDTINSELAAQANEHGLEVDFLQSNAESELINKIHQAQHQADFIIINPGAFGHTSIALRDALAGVNIPFFEVHISNIYRREAFRHHSYLADIAVGTLSGFGTDGYSLAMQAIINQLHRK